MSHSPQPQESKTTRSQEHSARGLRNEMETQAGEGQPGMTDLGPVFIFYSTVNSQSQLNGLMERVSLTYSDYTFGQINESIASLIQAKKEPRELAEESEDNL